MWKEPDSEVSSENDCNSKSLSITEEFEKVSRVSSDETYSDKKINCQDDSLSTSEYCMKKLL